MKQKNIRVLGVYAPGPRLTIWAVTLIAFGISAPVAAILWGIEWLWW